MDKIINFDEMKTIKVVYGVAGFYPGKDACKLRRAYYLLSDFIIFCVLLATVYQLLTHPSDKKESLSVSLVVTIAYFLTLYYSLCFRLQCQKIVDMKKMLEDVATSLSLEINKEAVVESTRHDVRYHKIYVMCGVFTAVMSAILFSVQPLLRSLGFFGKDGQKVLQIDTWCPYDCHAAIKFEITVFVQFVTVFWVAVRFFANDSFFIFAIKLNIQYFKLLKSLGKSVLSHISDIRPVGEQQDNTVLKKNHLKLLQPLDGKEIRFKRSSSIRYSKLELDEESEKLANDKLIIFIKEHQIVLR